MKNCGKRRLMKRIAKDPLCLIRLDICNFSVNNHFFLILFF